MDVLADTGRPLLAADEPPPVSIERPDGVSPLFLTCDHAGWRIPRRLGDLGVDGAERERHIAWDIGAEALARKLSVHFDATLAVQAYSRLVIDCNRSPAVPGSIPVVSERTDIPANRDIAPAEAAARVREIFDPYHAAIARALDARAAAARPSVYVAVHSFTPVYKDVARPWHVGILYNRDPRLARILLDLLAGEDGLRVGDNEPYFVDDLSDYGIPVHGEGRGIPHVLLEVRNDLIAHEAGQSEWAERLARLLERSLEELNAIA